MSSEILIEGIRTNNLKDISVSLKKNAINLIIGPSGSGKSSLAYDTIAQIGQHEFQAMFNDDFAEPQYIVNSYSNMVAAIPIKQTNYNHNLRSTIGTYFGLSKSIALIYASLLGVPESLFTLNKADNICPICHGLGVTSELDLFRVVSLSTPLAENPIRSWNKYKDFYKQIIIKYCEDNGIDPNKTFRQLTDSEKQLILTGKSEKKYSIKYKKRGAVSSRTTFYYGPFSGHSMMPDFTPGKQFYSDHECKSCHGKKYSSELSKFQIEGLSIGDFMTLSFEKLFPVVNKLLDKNKNTQISFTLQKIKNFTEKAVELHLGYLFFHRAIPTLSGGELQRLKMVQVFNSQLSDLLIVLDEPLAGLSGDEKEVVYQNIITLSRRHTLLIVDHSDKFISDSAKVFALGPGSGTNGGEIIDYKQYVAKESVKREYPVFNSSLQIRIHVENNIYRYHGARLLIPENSLCMIMGRSGVGKSTLLREYFPQQFDNYLYISQKPMEGSSDSYVATAIGIFGEISEIYAKNTKKNKGLFSNHSGDEGACPVCAGKGFIEYRHDAQTSVRLKCEDCEGTGFNKILKKYRVSGKSIFDIWGMTIDEGISFFEPFSKKITTILRDAASIMLGHLIIGQPTSTLSGGENIRIKILLAIRTKADIIGIDEPFRGLSSSEIYKVACYLERIRSKGKTIVVADHVDEAKHYFSKVIILREEEGVLTGE